MTARVVVVLDERFCHAVAAALDQQGYETVCLSDTMKALDALENPGRVELLVTRLYFAPTQPNGIGLARMARVKVPGVSRRP